MLLFLWELETQISHKIFDLILKYEYPKIFVFCFRDDGGLEIFKKQFSWFYKKYS